MGLRNELRKAVMSVPPDNSVLTGEDVADLLANTPGRWDLLRRFGKHHNALVAGHPGTEDISFDRSNILDEPLYPREVIAAWIARSE